jgi:DNA-binding response OmpR family regulator
MNETSQAQSQAAGQPPRVLVVEDDPDTLVFMGKALSRLPADAMPVATCEAARYAADHAGPFDVVIADVRLPDGDGVDLLAGLKRRHGCCTIVLSGTDEPPGGTPDSIDVWMTKPVDVEALFAAVRRLCRDAPAARRPAQGG